MCCVRALGESCPIACGVRKRRTGVWRRHVYDGVQQVVCVCVYAYEVHTSPGQCNVWQVVYPTPLASRTFKLLGGDASW